MDINFKSVSALVIICITLLGLIITNIFFNKIKITKRLALSTFWIVPLIGAILLICFQDVSMNNFWTIITANNSVNPLKVIALFFSMTLLSIFLDEIGFFSYLANFFARKINKNQFILFFGLYILISILTVFTSNDIIILTFTPFVISFCKKSKIDPLPYLIMEFISANTMSMCLIIGNPTNIYLATSFNIDFIAYFKTMIIPTLLASFTSILLLFLLFFKKLKMPITPYNGSENKPNKLLLTIGLTILLGTTILLAISSYINIEMWIVAIAGAGIELVFLIAYSLIKKDNIVIRVLKHIPYNLLPFILSMFILVLSLQEIGFSSLLANAFNSICPTFTYGYSGILAANLINNIPMSLLYGSILDGTNIKAIYASIAASNIAAYITPLGALAGLMFISLCKKDDVKISFIQFIKYGVIVGIPTITISLLLINFLNF
uniref:Citrate transporter-like domain-containing protein n=1 Tax=uncultured bacterium fosmid pJB84G2 TaxID=1478072 RepID=A0A0H3U8A1_9BACT|nr:hypothetical protein [uncultured bacterium fosmid pJB84G2]